MREHITHPTQGFEVSPRNSRYSMSYDNQNKRFSILDRKNHQLLAELSYTDGRYIYATLRGQQRIDEMGTIDVHPNALTKSRFMLDITSTPLAFTERELQALWKQIVHNRPLPAHIKNPSTTERHAYPGSDVFTFVEDARPRTQMDSLPRKKSREEDCHQTMRDFQRHAGLEPLYTDVVYQQFQSYESLARKVAEYKTPLLIELAARDSRVRGGGLLRVHSCSVITNTNGEFICFEKVGIAFPWRLTTLRDVFTLYETHYVQANKGHAKLFWAISTLEKRVEA